MNLRNIRLGSTPLTIGLIFGVIFALVLILYGYILAPFLGQLGSYIQLALPVIFGLLAGRRASIRTGKISSGLIAGFITGAVGLLLTAIITMITVFISLDAIRQQAQLSANKQHPIVHVTNGDIIQYYIQALAFTLIFAILLTIAGGSLGGFLGKGRARLAPAEETPGEVITTATPVQDAEETPEEVITTATPVQDDEGPTPSYGSNGVRRSAASRRSRNARRNRSMN